MEQPPRVIPVLLLSGRRLVKTVKFRRPRYVGDPVNAVRIFNDKEVDEIAVLDVDASRERRGPNFALIEEIASECFMPACYGGGITTLPQIRKVLYIGYEKVAINTALAENPRLIADAATAFGSQSIVASIDVVRNWRGRHRVAVRSGRDVLQCDPVSYARCMEELGAGEILLNAVDRDGMMDGYDLELIRRIAGAVDIPVVACGGAGTLAHMAEAVVDNGASAAAAGSMFVFHGKHRAVLINVPPFESRRAAFSRTS